MTTEDSMNAATMILKINAAGNALNLAAVSLAAVKAETTIYGSLSWFL